jgi:hypothetical protein
MFPHQRTHEEHLIGEPERNRSEGKSEFMWDDNIKMDFRIYIVRR